MQQPLISVIIPVYNVEKYLRKCVDSVLAQTYTNLEIILIDDGSTDNSGKICEEYALKDPRIKVIHQKNGGVCVARNIGLDTAVGEYVAFVDSDDYIFPDMYRTLLNAIQTHSADIALCKHQDVNLNGKLVSTISHIHNDFTYATYNQWFRDMVMYAAVAGVVWNKLFTRHCIGKHRFDVHFARAEDLNFILDITQTHYRVTVCSQIFYNYVQRPHSAVHQKKIKNFENEYMVWTRIWYMAKKLIVQNLELNYLAQYICLKAILPKGYKLAVLIILLDNYHQYDSRLWELEELFKRYFAQRHLLSSVVLRIWVYLFAKYPHTLVTLLRMPGIKQCCGWYIAHR